MELHIQAWIAAGVFTILSCISSGFLIWKHVASYTEPSTQRYIVRILAFVPIYAIDSWLSLRFGQVAIYFDVIRDCYGAYVLWSFYKLCESYMHGEEALVAVLEAKDKVAHPWPFCCIFSKPSKVFLMRTKQCILQYTLFKPLLAVLTMILELAGVYHSGEFEASAGYLWITILDNISITISLYALALFYMATAKELAEHQPIWKFICIKAVVFFSWWQGVLIAILVFAGAIKDVDEYSAQDIANGLQDFIICIEMFIISIAHHFAFSYKPYEINAGAKQPLLRVSDIRELKPISSSVSDVLNFRDDIEDTYQSFHPDTLVQTVPGARSVRSRAGKIADAFDRMQRDSRRRSKPLRADDDSSSSSSDGADDLAAASHHHQPTDIAAIVIEDDDEQEQQQLDDDSVDL
jgi:Organic solute transporter Ostalpha